MKLQTLLSYLGGKTLLKIYDDEKQICFAQYDYSYKEFKKKYNWCMKYKVCMYYLKKDCFEIPIMEIHITKEF